MIVPIKVKDLTKKFISVNSIEVNALNNVSFEINENEFISVVGPSGSGKSTLLNILAGIEKPTSGNIRFGADIKNKIGYVFQDITIFPWLTIKKNLLFPLELKKKPLAEKIKIVYSICEQIGFDTDTFLTKYPKELSGGEKRRVAIGMALAQEAELLLLDEPTTQLDYINKWHIQNLLQRIWLEKKITTILVTHDIEESIYLGDRIIILENGSIKAIIKIDLPRPRTNEIRINEVFIQYKKEVMKYFY